ncbi:MAG: BON domain-containing protein [bacterium]
MGLFFKSKKYDDDDLSLSAERAIKEHPILKSLTNISVLSEDGEVQIIGKVKTKSYKNRVLRTVESKFKRSNKVYKNIKNNLEIS